MINTWEEEFAEMVIATEEIEDEEVDKEEIVLEFIRKLLSAERAATIEECARVVEKTKGFEVYRNEKPVIVIVRTDSAIAIRNLGKKVTS